MKKFFNGARAQAAIVLLAGSLAAADAATVTTLGGGPTPGNFSKTGSRNGSTLWQAKFNQPYGIAVHDDGSLIIADKKNKKLRRVVLPGDAELSYTETFAKGLPLPSAVAVDSSGNVYAANERKGTVNVYDGYGVLLNTYGGFGKLTSIAVDSGGTIYVADTGGAISWIGTNGSSGTLVGGFVKPTGLALIDDSKLAVADGGSHGIYTVDTVSGVATLFSGGNGVGFKDGAASVAQFNTPWGLARGLNGSLVVADRLNHRVRIIDSEGAVTTVYGTAPDAWFPPFAGWQDGSPGLGREPVGVAVATNGTIYVTEAFWHTIRQVTVVTNVGSTNEVDETNTVSVGFGSAWSDLVAAAGQTSIPPVTLSTAECGVTRNIVSSRLVFLSAPVENMIRPDTKDTNDDVSTNTGTAFVSIRRIFEFKSGFVHQSGPPRV